MKTNAHNKRLYRDMQEEPDKYPDQEIEAMMDDLDQEADVDEAWQQFAQQHTLPMRCISAWRKIAAILFGVLTISGIAFAAVNFVRQSQHEDKQGATIAEPQATTQKSHANPTDTIAMTSIIIFDNITLDSIAKDIAAYHHLGMDLQSETSSQLRFYFVWNQEDDLQEVIEKLNMFEQVHLSVENGQLTVR